MTLKEMIARVMRVLSQTEAPDRWGETDIISLLNDGQSVLSKAAEKPRTRVSVLPIGIASVSLPPDFMQRKDVYWGDVETKKELVFVTTPGTKFDQPETTGDPKYYKIIDNKLLVMPVPTAEKSLYINYFPKPASMVRMDDVPELEHAERAIIAYAIHQAFFESGNPQSERWEAEYMKRRDEWLDTQEQHREVFQVERLW